MTRNTPPMKFQDKSLLRAAPACRVLHRFAEIFSARLGTAEDYNMSRVNDHIDCFITHNWIVGRFWKFTVLTLHFNTKPALIIAVLCCFTVTCFAVLGWLPVFEVIDRENDFSHKQGIWCLAFGLPVFWLSVTVWHEVIWLIGCTSPFVFVDKCCIHQTNPELKSQGIQHLSAYLEYSWSVVVCYTNIYLKKLWTIYEVASFLTLHPGGGMQVIPVVLPTAIFVASWLQEAIHAIHFLTAMPGLGDDVRELSLVGVLTCFAYVWIIRRWAEERSHMLEISRQFRVADAICSIESDRAIVQNDIVALVKHFELVPDGASDREALDIFEGLVHAEVPRFFAASLGRVGVPYEYALIVSLPTVFVAFDVLAGYILEGLPARTLCCRLLYDLTAGLAGTPLLAVALSSKLAELSLKLGADRVRGLLCCIGIMVFVGVIFGVNGSLLRSLSHTANTDSVSLGVFLSHAGILYLLTFFMYRPVAYINYTKRSRRSYEPSSASADHA